MRPLPAVPLKRSQTVESLNSVDSIQAVSVASSDRPQVVQMVPKVDVEIKFNGENVPNGRPMSRSQSVQSLVSNRSVSTIDSHRSSISAMSGISNFTLTADALDEVQLSAEDMRRLRIENQMLKAADHRQKAEICDLRAQIIKLNGQLSKCRDIAMMLKGIM